MLILKHIKQDVKSTIDLVLDKELTAEEGIFQEELDNKFMKGNEKHTFRLEHQQMIVQNGDITILELMKCLRKKHWLLMTSHSFMHLSLEKTMESHFYFERILDPNHAPPNMTAGTTVVPAGGGQHHVVGGPHHGHAFVVSRKSFCSLFLIAFFLLHSFSFFIPSFSNNSARSNFRKMSKIILSNKKRWIQKKSQLPLRLWHCFWTNLAHKVGHMVLPNVPF